MNKATPFRCHDADACALGQSACPTPSICGCAAPACAVTHHTDTERAEFEAWAIRNGVDLSKEEGSNEYFYSDANEMWAAWQAALRAPAVPVPQSIEQMAVDRYKVVPSHSSMFYPCAVVAGDGQQQLYIGREAECQNMARKFTGAFLDGAFVALAAAPQPPVPQVTPEMIEAALEAYMPFGDMELAIQCALFAAPQPAAQERKPLTDDEIDKLPWGPHEGNPVTFAEGLRDFARAIERAHGITGGAA